MGDYGFEGAGEFGGSDFPYEYAPPENSIPTQSKKITQEEIQEEKNNASKEQDILRRVFSLFADSFWEDYKLVPDYCKKISMPRSLGQDINAAVQKSFPKWYTKQIKIHKSNMNKKREE